MPALHRQVAAVIHDDGNDGSAVFLREAECCEHRICIELPLPMSAMTGFSGFTHLIPERHAHAKSEAATLGSEIMTSAHSVEQRAIGIRCVIVSS